MLRLYRIENVTRFGGVGLFVANVAYNSVKSSRHVALDGELFMAFKDRDPHDLSDLLMFRGQRRSQREMARSPFGLIPVVDDCYTRHRARQGSRTVGFGNRFVLLPTYDRFIL